MMPPKPPDVEFFLGCFEWLGPPSTEAALWHYTSLESLLRIVETKSLLLTSERFLNDPNEGLAARDWLQRMAEHVVKHESLIVSEDALAKVRTADRVFGHAGRQYCVFSLSAGELKLSQWARYGANGAGCAIRFDFDDDRLTKTEGAFFGANLRAVKYVSRTNFGDEASEAEIYSALKALAEASREDNDLFYLGLQQGIDLLAPLIKQDDYREESEWRLFAVALLERPDSYEIHPCAYGLAPRVRVPFDRGIRIREIVLGPKASEENLWSLDWLCKKRFPGETIPITRSALAYR